MRTHNAYRRAAWRCPACGLTCQCLAEHYSCTARPFAPQYGHHLPEPLDVDQLQQDGAQAAYPVVLRGFPGE